MHRKASFLLPTENVFELDKILSNSISITYAAQYIRGFPFRKVSVRKLAQ